MTNENLFDIEEQRYSKVSDFAWLKDHPSKAIISLEHQLRNPTEAQLVELVTIAGKLWKEAKARLQSDPLLDDRWLYWQRLLMRRMIKTSETYQLLTTTDKQELLKQIEYASRGNNDSHYLAETDLKILVTGFDPFFLDREINQSNPSGAAALALDGKVIEYRGITAEIEAFLIPVRFIDFEQGMIEEFLQPYYRQVDMITTISMGRSDFDLERFPGLRRSAEAPDNLNIYTGASASKPLIPLLNDKSLTGPEFVEFSLPVAAMIEAEGRYKINDNREVTTLENGQFSPNSLTQLQDQTAVRGGGGGYLSNEISYRSIRLRNLFNPGLAVGHIHTPRIKAFDPKSTEQIVAQITRMLELSLPVLAEKKGEGE